MKVAFVMNADFQKDAEGQLNLNAVRHNGFQNGGGNHLEMYFKFMVMGMAAAVATKRTEHDEDKDALWEMKIFIKSWTRRQK